MSRFSRVLWFRYKNKESPSGKAIMVLQDDCGWFYLKKLLEIEGVATPFGSIAEIEVYVGEELEQVGDSPISPSKQNNNE